MSEVNYYHVTKAENIQDIIKYGLIPKGAGEGKGFSPALKHKTRIYLWTNIKSAYYFMDEMSEYFEKPEKLAVFEVKVPSDIKLYKDEEMGLDITEGGFIRESIPYEDVKLTDTVIVNVPGEKTVMQRYFPDG